MELSVSKYVPDQQWVMWEEILIPRFTDDRVITKLWCTKRMFQAVIRARTMKLVCHVRCAIRPSDRYLLPPFLSQLTRLKYLSLRDHRAANTRHEYVTPNYHSIYDRIPSSVTTLDISGITLPEDVPTLGDGPLMKFLRTRPDLKLVTDPTEIVKITRTYHELLVKITDMIIGSTEFTSLATIDSFTTINSDVVIVLRDNWTTLRPDIKLWIEQEWCPKVNTVYFGYRKHDVELEQWCYNIFRNIIHSTNAISTPPPRLQTHSNFCSQHDNPQPFSHIFTLPYLTKLAISVHDNISIIPLPLTVLDCTIYVTIKQPQYQEFLERLVDMLPSTVDRFVLHVIIPLALGQIVTHGRGQLATRKAGDF